MALGTPVFSKGTRVVYPNQGVCRVVGQIEMTIGGQSAIFLKLSRENDDGAVMIPLDKIADVGVRRLASAAEIATLFEQLSAPDLGPDLNWKTRHRSHGERMSEGDVFAMAEVVKELAALSDLRPLPTKERELYDNARHLLVGEIAAALGLDEASAEDAIDFALFPPGVERRKLAALALDALAGLADDDDGALDLDEDLLAGADTLDGLEGDASDDELLDGGDRDGPLAMEELDGDGAAAPRPAKAAKKKASTKKAATPKQGSANAAKLKKKVAADGVEVEALEAAPKPAARTTAPPVSSRKKKGAAPTDGLDAAATSGKAPSGRSKVGKAAPRAAKSTPSPKSASRRAGPKKEKPT